MNEPTRWRSVKEEPPPEGEVVEVMNNGGVPLKHHDGLWFFPDDSMYVYYTPEWWRPRGEWVSECRGKEQLSRE